MIDSHLLIGVGLCLIWNLEIILEHIYLHAFCLSLSNKNLLIINEMTIDSSKWIAVSEENLIHKKLKDVRGPENKISCQLDRFAWERK